MKKVLLFLSLIYFDFSFSLFQGFAQVPSWQWAKCSSVSGTGSQASAVAVDASGNAYMAGQFGTTVSFATDTLSSPESPSYLFLTKYNSRGNVLWAKKIIGTGSYNPVWAYTVAVDSSGNVYISGYFATPSITFETITLTNTGDAGHSDIFLAKYDNNGNLLWAKSVGGALTAGNYLDDEATSMALDNSGNIYLSGYFNSQSITFGLTTLVNNHIFGYYYSDIFLAKYDSNGNVLWASSAGGTSNDRVTSVAVDANNNAYLTGWYTSDTLIFGIDTLYATVGGTSDMFLAKYNANGNPVWAKSAGCEGGSEVYPYIGISSDTSSQNNKKKTLIEKPVSIYVAGYFYSRNIIFGSDTLKNNNTDNSMDIFLVKYDSKGNVQWTKDAGGSSNDVVNGIAVDTLGNAYLTGYFQSSKITIGDTTLLNSFYNGTDVDLFIVKFNHNGNVVWAKSAGGSSSDKGSSVAVNNSGVVYLAGWFKSPTLSLADTTLTSTVDGSYFLTKIKDTVLVLTGIAEPVNIKSEINIYPNPGKDNIIVEPAPIGILSLVNITGQEMKRQIITSNKIQINISDLPGGIYFVNVQTNNGLIVKKIIKE